MNFPLKLATKAGNDKIILLKCTSSYPAPNEDSNLAMIPDMAKRFGVITGLSDHTIRDKVPVAATVLGVRVIEKHFILDRSIGEPDSSFSLDEAEFAAMVNAVREAEKAIGKVDYTVTEKMLKSRKFARSLYVVEDIKAGEFLTEKNFRSIRTGHGLHPKYYKQVQGKVLKLDFVAGKDD